MLLLLKIAAVAVAAAVVVVVAVEEVAVAAGLSAVEQPLRDVSMNLNGGVGFLCCRDVGKLLVSPP